MQNDTFFTNHFRLNYHGFEIIKNGRKFKHIDFAELDSVEIKKGRNIKNWLAVFILGVLITIFSLRKIIKVTPLLKIIETGYPRATIGLYISLYILSFFGMAIACASIKKQIIIEVILRNKQVYIWPLSKILRNKKLDTLIDFLDQRTKLNVMLPKSLQFEKEY